MYERKSYLIPFQKFAVTYQFNFFTFSCFNPDKGIQIETETFLCTCIKKKYLMIIILQIILIFSNGFIFEIRKPEIRFLCYTAWIKYHCYFSITHYSCSRIALDRKSVV